MTVLDVSAQKSAIALLPKGNSVIVASTNLRETQAWIIEYDRIRPLVNAWQAPLFLKPLLPPSMGSALAPCVGAPLGNSGLYLWVEWTEKASELWIGDLSFEGSQCLVRANPRIGMDGVVCSEGDTEYVIGLHIRDGGRPSCMGFSISKHSLFKQWRPRGAPRESDGRLFMIDIPQCYTSISLEGISSFSSLLMRCESLCSEPIFQEAFVKPLEKLETMTIDDEGLSRNKHMASLDGCSVNVEKTSVNSKGVEIPLTIAYGNRRSWLFCITFSLTSCAERSSNSARS